MKNMHQRSLHGIYKATVSVPFHAVPTASCRTIQRKNPVVRRAIQFIKSFHVKS